MAIQSRALAPIRFSLPIQDPVQSATWILGMALDKVGMGGPAMAAAAAVLVRAVPYSFVQELRL